MKPGLKLTLLLIVILAASLACQAATDLVASPTPERETPARQEQPEAEAVVETEEPQPEEVVVITVVVEEPAEVVVETVEVVVETVEPEVPVLALLFEDDFSDPTSGWDRVETDRGSTDYLSGEYRILVNETMWDAWANPGLWFGDVRVEVEAFKAGGPDDNDFGVICRYQDIDNFYYFIISSDGYYGIFRVVDGAQEILGTDGMEYSDAIFQGATTNYLRADCVGDLLTLYVNDVYLFSVSDRNLAEGDVGLIAGTFSEPGTDIRFDNFTVLAP